MEVLPEFKLVRPATLQEAVDSANGHDGARFLAGGTDLIVNLRRGIGEASLLVDLSEVAELGEITTTNDGGVRIGAAVKLAGLARNEKIASDYPVMVEAAREIAGPTHQRFATVGGNICLDTRCIYYNQSHWWRKSNDYCLKYRGDICHVAPKSKKGFAAFSGDLAPALIVLGAELDIIGPEGARTIPLQDLYVEDGADHLTLSKGEFITHVTVPPAKPGIAAYRKVRVRDAIDFPLAGAAVRLHRKADILADLAIAFTGTNSRPLPVSGLEDMCGAALDETVLEQILRLANKQIQPMKSTFSPSTYRRAVATKLAIHLIRELWQQGSG